MNRPIVIESLTLWGFGPYRDAARAEFPRGLGVLVGPNEQGKSTLVAGIVAVLFGLPGLSSPEGFGVGRYRNWDDPSRFAGEMTLDAGGVRYRLRRNFDNHRISLSRLDDDGWVEVIVGEHNPAGKKPNAAYNDWLHSLFHHTSRELFQSTFCVVQPLPPVDRLSAELQSLLAGGGSGRGHEAALDFLVEAAKAITRETKALGLTSRDMRNEGRLDQTRAEIARLEAEIAASERAVRALHETSEELARLAGDEGERRERLAAVRRSLEAFESWRQRAERAHALSEELVKLRKARERHALLERQAQEAADEQRRLYPELAAAPAELGDGLAVLQEVVGRVNELNGVIQEAGRLESRLQELAQRRRGLEMPVPPGETAVSWMRQVARDVDEATRGWKGFEAERERVRQLRARLLGDYATFEEAAPATLQAIEAYDERRATLAAAVERARRDLAQAEEARREAAMARQKLEERFPRAARWTKELEGLAGRVEGLLQRTADAGEAERRLTEARSKARKDARRAWGVAAIGAAVAVLGHLTTLGFAAVLGWVIALAAVAFGLVTGSRHRNELASLQAEVDRLARERQQAADALGEAGRLSPEELSILAEEIRRYEEAEELVRPLEERAPSDKEVERLRNALAEAEARLAAWEEMLRAPREAFDDFRSAYAHWKSLRQELADAEQGLRRVLATWGLSGIDPDAVEEAGIPEAGQGVAGLWRRLFDAVAQLRAGRVVGASRGGEAGALAGALSGAASASEPCFGGLVEAVFELSAAVPRLLERAQTQDELDREIAQVEKTRSLLVSDDGRDVVRGHLEWIEGQCRRLAATFGQGWLDVAEAVRKQARAGSLVSVDRLLDSLPAPFREVVAAAGQSVERARERWRDFSRLGQAVRDAHREMRSLLAALECQDVEALEKRVELTNAQMALQLQAMEQLAREHPGLPAPRADGAYGDVGERYRALTKEAERLSEDLERLEQRRVELIRRQAELQGGAPANIAQAEIRLEELRATEERLRFELDALVVAHQELAAAAAEYYDSHLDRLEGRTGEYFASVTHRPGRRVQFDDELRLTALEADGKRLLPAQLSQGARDQLYLSLRMAVADLLTGGYTPPLILDDPFQNCDEERLEAIREALVRLARDRQILFFTHRGDLAAWGEPISLKRGADVMLDGGREAP